MTAIVVYGSLINQEQLVRASKQFCDASPILVKGFRRAFNQEPSWREGCDQSRAVLNVTPSSHDCFNGILVHCDAGIFRSLDERETGYSRIHWSDRRLAP